MYTYTFLLRMTDTMTSQNIDLSSWDILYMRRYGDGEKLGVEVLADLDAFNTREFRQVGLAMPQTELLDEFSSYLIFKSLRVFILGWCPVNMSALAPKIGGLQISPKSQNCNFLENDSCDSDQISATCGDLLHKQNSIDGVFGNMTVLALAAHMFTHRVHVPSLYNQRPTMIYRTIDFVSRVT
jgi:hypothetical protein